MTSIPSILMRAFEEVQTDPVIQSWVSGLSAQSECSDYHPLTDLVETDTTIKIFMDVPGINGDAIDVDFYNNTIEVKGERVCPLLDEEISTSNINEIEYGHFKRFIVIPISVTNKNSVNVTCKDGVLKIVIDKTNEEKNKFTVKVGEGSSS